MLSDWLERRTGNPNTTPSEKSPPGSRASVAYKRTAQNVPTAASRYIRASIRSGKNKLTNTVLAPFPSLGSFLDTGMASLADPLHGYKWAQHTSTKSRMALSRSRRSGHEEIVFLFVLPHSLYS